MTFRISTVTATLGVAALAAGFASTPATAAPAEGPGIHYQASLAGRSVVITTDGGGLAARDNQFQVLDDGGRVIAALPLDYQMHDRVWPIAAVIEGNRATLTPSTDPAASTPVPAGTPKLDSIDATANPNFNQALSNLSSATAIGAAVGTLIGTAIGAGVGCLAGGALVGAGATAATLGTLTIPGAIGGCIVTAAAAAPLGAAAGLVAIGGPITVIALIQFFADLATPPAPARTA
ncbi:hypothetical protein LTV02_11825 [Nocardia yamanashiensis]|uniref:hypothetical protein n=1 Tax=Nocardia yamanashiensis TaxID=209247 RepID=UPI001E514972|nr:hypothetical protein [Nocardia yamanashiensis]UGT44022.1 hypothetical protein LTV02_11825 [Nocardia yamanashiensis]